MKSSFRALLVEGIRKFASSGYTSEAELQEWLGRLQVALERELLTDKESREELTRILLAVYERDIRSGIMRRVPGVSRYTLDRVAPQLRAELDRRIFAAADLIRLRKRATVEKTLQRFSGWVSSIPPEGTFDFSARAQSRKITKDLTQLKFERRRVAIDQAHKLSAAVAHVVATGEGAIAAIWHDRGEDDKTYDYRPDHLARSGNIFFVRDSWAIEQGLIKRSGRPYTDEITQPGQEIYCSCFYEYITDLARIPEKYLTARGRAWLKGMRLDSSSTTAAMVSNFRNLENSTSNGVEKQEVIAPTAAQIEAGNYRKGHLRIHGLEISIETSLGNTRRGVSADGQHWAVVMPADYGYIRRTIGADGEQIDCYVGPNHDAPSVWIVEQLDAHTQKYDEDKVLLGFPSRAVALETYESGFSDGLGKLRIGSVREFSVENFRQIVLTPHKSIHTI